MRRLSLFLIVSFFLTSCTSIYFKNQQPKNSRNLSSFPLEMRGMYASSDLDTLIIVADGFYLASMQDTKTKNEFMALSDSLILRKGISGYFLNMKNNEYWHVFHTKIIGKHLSVKMITPDDSLAIAKLNNITSVQEVRENSSSALAYLIDPSEEEFEEMLNAGVFTNVVNFDRIVLFPDAN